MSRIAAIDYGRKRIGFAYTDPLKIIVSATCVFDNSPNTLVEICNFINEKEIKELVVGLPSFDTNHELSKEIKLFAEKLAKLAKVSIHYVDESYSSKNAGKLMPQLGMKKNKRQIKGTTDKIAAALILEDFMRGL